ncbi:unnamed protein product, partial [Didymodactylos carnosus]
LFFTSRNEAMDKSETHCVDGDIWSFRLDDKPLIDVDYNESRFDTSVVLGNTIYDGTVADVLGVTETDVITTSASETITEKFFGSVGCTAVVLDGIPTLTNRVSRRALHDLGCDTLGISIDSIISGDYI